VKADGLRGQGDGLLQKLALRKNLAAVRMAGQNSAICVKNFMFLCIFVANSVKSVQFVAKIEPDCAKKPKKHSICYLKKENLAVRISDKSLVSKNYQFLRGKA
jgi:hypothetical protein